MRNETSAPVTLAQCIEPTTPIEPRASRKALAWFWVGVALLVASLVYQHAYGAQCAAGDLDCLVTQVETWRDEPHWTHNPAHARKWNQVLATLGQDSPQSAMAESLIRSRAAKWPSSRWAVVTAYLDWRDAQAQQQAPPPPQVETVDPPVVVVQAQEQPTLPTPPGFTTDDEGMFNARSWGPWDDLPVATQTALSGVSEVTEASYRPGHADAKAPGEYTHDRVCDQNSCSIVPYGSLAKLLGRTEYRTLGNARFEGVFAEGQYVIHPNVARSASNPWGFYDPRIRFDLNMDATTMDVGISYAYKNPGKYQHVERRNTFEKWYRVDISEGATFENDGLRGVFLGTGQYIAGTTNLHPSIAGTVVRPRIIGTFAAQAYLPDTPVPAQ